MGLNNNFLVWWSHTVSNCGWRLDDQSWIWFLLLLLLLDDQVQWFHPNNTSKFGDYGCVGLLCFNFRHAGSWFVWRRHTTAVHTLWTRSKVSTHCFLKFFLKNFSNSHFSHQKKKTNMFFLFLSSFLFLLFLSFLLLFFKIDQELPSCPSLWSSSGWFYSWCCVARSTNTSLVY